MSDVFDGQVEIIVHLAHGLSLVLGRAIAQWCKHLAEADSLSLAL